MKRSKLDDSQFSIPNGRTGGLAESTIQNLPIIREFNLSNIFKKNKKDKNDYAGLNYIFNTNDKGKNILSKIKSKGYKIPTKDEYDKYNSSIKDFLLSKHVYINSHHIESHYISINGTDDHLYLIYMTTDGTFFGYTICKNNNKYIAIDIDMSNFTLNTGTIINIALDKNKLKESNGNLLNNIGSIQETKRSKLDDSQFGIPQERKYPLDTESHVRSAVKMFNYVDPKYEKQLANNVIKAMKKFKVTDMNISKQNRLYQYMNESYIDELNTKLDSLNKIFDSVDTVVFDMGSVLIDDNNAKEAFKNAANPIIRDNYEAIYDAVGKYLFGSEALPNIATCSAEEALEHFKLEAPDEFKDFADEIFDIIANSIKVYDYAVPLVGALKREGYSVYYLSNWDRWGIELEGDAFKPLTRIMDGGLFSYEVDLEKPNEEIYKKFLEKYNLNPQTCVFIDDKFENVYSAVYNVNMYGIHFTDETKKLLLDKFNIYKSDEDLINETLLMIDDLIDGTYWE